jgi:hypothetical protein
VSSDILNYGDTGQVICTVKYADDLVLLAEEETMLRGMINRLIETGRCCGRDECGKDYSNENIEGTIPSTDYDRSEPTVECGIFRLFG